MHEFYEFFAGGGMVRAGLGEGWRCLFANDFDHKKSAVYRQNWGDRELRTLDVGKLAASDLPGKAELVWASFPCQDLSLAGWGAGLKGDRSGTFWAFWELMKGLIASGRAPAMIALENVCGTLTSHNGKDFEMICHAVLQAGYAVGALVVDAALFVPQSRPRLFLVCVHKSIEIPEQCVSSRPVFPWHTRVAGAFHQLPKKTTENWVWWNPPLPPQRSTTFADVLEDEPDTRWFSRDRTKAVLAAMSEIHSAKIRSVKRENRRMVGGLYMRMRLDENGRKIQRAEVRFDDLSGCLRTPAGGSSRQTIVVVDGPSVRARLITRRETARLMGLPDTYQLPENYNEAYHLTGDGVVVPVVRHLAQHLFEPVLKCRSSETTAAA